MPTGAVQTRNAATSTFPIESQHFYDLRPESRFVNLGQRAFDEAPLLYMLSNGMALPTRSVTDVEFRTLTQHDDITEIQLTGVDATASATAITATLTTFALRDVAQDISNANLLVRPGDILHIPSQQTNQDTALGTVAAAGENVRVVDVNAAGTIVTVVRDIGGNTGATTQHITASSGDYLDAMILGRLEGEVSRSASPINHPGTYIYQYMPLLKEPFEASDQVMNIVLAGGDPFEIEMGKKLKKMRLQIEYSMLFDKMYRNISATDGTGYRQRGILPFITGDLASSNVYSASTDLVTGDGTSQIWNVGAKANFTPSNLDVMLAYLYQEGSTRKVLFGGGGFLQLFADKFRDYINISQESALAGRLGMNVRSYAHPHANEPLVLMNHHLLTGPYWYDAFVVDLDLVRKASMPGGELKIWKGKNGTGLQENDVETTKHAWRYQGAIDPLNELAFAWITGVQNDDGSFGGRRRTVGTRTTTNV